jgi:hypothetical protein
LRLQVVSGLQVGTAIRVCRGDDLAIVQPCRELYRKLCGGFGELWRATVHPVRGLPHAAAIIGFLAAGRTVSMIHSFQSPESIGRDIEKLQLSAIVAERRDRTDEVIAAAGYAGSAGVARSLTAPLVAAVTGLERRGKCR